MPDIESLEPKVNFIRGAESQISNLEITDGQFIVSEEGNIYVDIDNERIPIKENDIIAVYEKSPTTASHSVDDYIYYNNKLYRVILAIAIEDTIAIGTNVELANDIEVGTKVYISGLPESTGGGVQAVDVGYDNTTSGLSATNVQEAIDEISQGGGASSADEVSYDNTESGLYAENAQDAIDEIASTNSNVEVYNEDGESLGTYRIKKAVRGDIEEKYEVKYHEFPSGLEYTGARGLVTANNTLNIITANEIYKYLGNNEWEKTHDLPFTFYSTDYKEYVSDGTNIFIFKIQSYGSKLYKASNDGSVTLLIDNVVPDNTTNFRCTYCKDDSSIYFSYLSNSKHHLYKVDMTEFTTTEVAYTSYNCQYIKDIIVKNGNWYLYRELQGYNGSYYYGIVRNIIKLSDNTDTQSTYKYLWNYNAYGQWKDYPIEDENGNIHHFRAEGQKIVTYTDNTYECTYQSPYYGGYSDLNNWNTFGDEGYKYGKNWGTISNMKICLLNDSIYVICNVTDSSTVDYYWYIEEYPYFSYPKRSRLSINDSTEDIAFLRNLWSTTNVNGYFDVFDDKLYINHSESASSDLTGCYECIAEGRNSKISGITLTEPYHFDLGVNGNYNRARVGDWYISQGRYVTVQQDSFFQLVFCSLKPEDMFYGTQASKTVYFYYSDDNIRTANQITNSGSGTWGTTTAIKPAIILYYKADDALGIRYTETTWTDHAFSVIPMDVIKNNDRIDLAKYQVGNKFMNAVNRGNDTLCPDNLIYGDYYRTTNYYKSNSSTQSATQTYIKKLNGRVFANSNTYAINVRTFQIESYYANVSNYTNFILPNGINIDYVDVGDTSTTIKFNTVDAFVYNGFVYYCIPHSGGMKAGIRKIGKLSHMKYFNQLDTSSSFINFPGDTADTLSFLKSKFSSSVTSVNNINVLDFIVYYDKLYYILGVTYNTNYYTGIVGCIDLHLLDDDFEKNKEILCNNITYELERRTTNE